MNTNERPIIQRKYTEYLMRQIITMNNSCDLFSIFVMILARFLSFFVYLLQRNMRKRKQERERESKEEGIEVGK